MPSRFRSRSATLALAAALSLPLGARAEDAPKDPAKATAAANNRAGFDLLKALKKDGTNTFLSPTSIGMCLHLATTAAGGATRDQMLAAMHAAGVDLPAGNRALLNALAGDKEVTLRVANSVWSDPRNVRLNADFALASAKHFDALVRSVDFALPATRDVINGWVGAKTEGKIPELLGDLDPATAAILVNAVYFKGAWSLEFDPKLTTDADFATAGGARRVRMMSCHDAYHYAVVDGTQVIRLPYGQDGRFAMWVALPAAGKGLDAWMGGFDGDDLAAWATSAAKRGGTIELPRFKLRYKEQLNDALQGLGMKDAFVAGAADFAKLGENSGQGFFISRVLHEAILEVNEQGTVAAAATALETLGAPSEPPPQFAMRCDRPFFLAITDRATGSVLFMGAVHAPDALE